MADTSLIKKLGIKPKYRLLILHAPEGYREQLGTYQPAWNSSLPHLQRVTST